MKLIHYLRGLCSIRPDLTTQQLEKNRVLLQIRREANLHDKRLRRISPTFSFTFTREQYAQLLRAARASHLDITTFFQKAALTQAEVSRQLKYLRKAHHE